MFEGILQGNWLRKWERDNKIISGLKVEKKYVLNMQAEEEVRFECTLSRWYCKV